MKKKFGLTTDTAGDLKGAVYGISAVIITMEPGWDRTFLISLFLIIMAIISWLTVSSAAADDPGEPPADRQLPEDPAEIVRRGRE